jgi:hypothetical protein
MRTPLVAPSFERAKSLAVELFQSKDWRCKFTAVYYLQFYLKPREIMHVLKARPVDIRDSLKALKIIREKPWLIKLNSIKEVIQSATNL